MAARYWVGGTASWDGTAGTKWALTSGGAGGQAIPGSADDVFLDGASGAVTITYAVGATFFNSLLCTGFTGTLVINSGTDFGINGTGNFTLVSGMTFTATGTTYFGNATGTILITSAGKSFGATNFSNAGARTLQDAFVGTGIITLAEGTLNTNGMSVSCTRLVCSGASTEVLTLGASAITLTGTGSVLDLSSSALTVNANTSTITFSDTSASSKTFVGGGKTFNNVTITGGGAGTFDITGANTFNVFTIGAPKTVRFTAATTSTFTSFVALGTSGNVITISSITAATHTLSDASGNNNCTFLSLTNSIATGGAIWNARSSTNVSGNTGWNFTSAPGMMAFFD